MKEKLPHKNNVIYLYDKNDKYIGKYYLKFNSSELANEIKLFKHRDGAFEWAPFHLKDPQMIFTRVSPGPNGEEFFKEVDPNDL